MMRSGDRNWVVSTTKSFQIRGHQLRGYEPWYTLWERTTFWKWSWWAFVCWSDEIKSLTRRIEKCEEFDRGVIPKEN